MNLVLNDVSVYNRYNLLNYCMSPFTPKLGSIGTPINKKNIQHLEQLLRRKIILFNNINTWTHFYNEMYAKPLTGAK